MYTVDASVWVNGFDRSEKGHEISRRFLEHLHRESRPVFLPTLARVEIAGAIARTRGEPERAQDFVTALVGLPNVTLFPLEEDLARQAQGLAASHRLRGADAVYAAVALQFACTLVSLDREHLTRVDGIVAVRTPSAALAEAGSWAEEDGTDEQQPHKDSD